MPVGEVTIPVDASALHEALELFEERLNECPGGDVFVDDMLALFRDGVLFEIVSDSEMFRIKPSGEFEAILEEMR